MSIIPVRAYSAVLSSSDACLTKPSNFVSSFHGSFCSFFKTKYLHSAPLPVSSCTSVIRFCNSSSHPRALVYVDLSDGIKLQMLDSTPQQMDAINAADDKHGKKEHTIRDQTSKPQVTCIYFCKSTEFCTLI